LFDSHVRAARESDEKATQQSPWRGRFDNIVEDAHWLSGIRRLIVIFAATIHDFVLCRAGSDQDLLRNNFGDVPDAVCFHDWTATHQTAAGASIAQEHS
jgi:hypothetical protein